MIQKDTILMRLAEHAKINGLNLLFAIEAGSRAWGFESPDSDYDIRFVYHRPLAWYISIQDRRDVFEPKEEFPLDINGWDIKKALYQIYKGNSCFFEWLNSPISYLSSQSLEELKKLSQQYFNPRTAIYHYLHMADGNYREYLRGEEVWTKKYLYVIRPILCCIWIEQHHSMPPVSFDELFNWAATYANSHIPSSLIFELIERKKKGMELDKGPRISAVNDWLDNRIKHFAEKARLVQKVEKMPDDLNEYFMSLF